VWLTIDTLEQPNETLPLDYLSELIRKAAEQNGIPVSAVTEQGAMAVLLKAAEGATGGLQTVVLEKVARYILGENLAGAGKLIRDFALDGAIRVRTERLAKQSVGRRLQLSGFAKKGNERRRIYTADDKNQWRARAAKLPPRLSKLRKAQLIAEQVGLPSQAVETIRRVIG